jgi:hypothetical protein
MKLTAAYCKASFGRLLERRAIASAVFLVLFFVGSVAPAFAGPSIAVMTPQTGPVGTLVEIIGSGFGASQGTSTVTFNGTSVTWVSWSSTTLSVQVPAGATSGNVVVKVGGVSSSGKSFTVSPSPVITGVSPTSAAVGATLTITGSNFTAGGTQTPQVVFNPELYASPITSTDTSITVAVPAGATTGDLVVSVGGGNSNGVLFTVTSSDPSISSLSPGGGAVGTAVTITGANFGSSRGTSTVTFNGTAGTPTNWSGSSITVPVPTGATTGNVLVTVGGVVSNPYGFEVGTAAPNITSISPTSGAVSTSVTIKGTAFGSTQGSNTVTFNGVSSVPTSWSATQIKVPAPTGATSGSVVVTASGTVSNSVSFTVPGTGPSITSLSPSSAPLGASVTITGTNFDATQGTSTVKFNGVAATATGWSPTSIVATVPSGATSGNVVVTVSGTASGGFSFSVAPNITNLSPGTGAVGATVTISGASFGSSQGTSTVTFNGTAATPTSWGSGSITVPVPSGATTGNVVVAVGGAVSNGASFTVQSGAFVATSGQMEASRYGQTATQLITGEVLIAGGMSSSGVVNSAELYTSASQTFAAAPNAMNVARWLHTATLLNDGTVLIAGGSSVSSETTLNSAEIYDPVAGTFTLLPSTLNTARVGHTATLLSNGQVLIVGGFDPTTGIISDAELYDPTAQVFIDLGNTNSPRFHHSATLLQNGQVLIAGGETDPTPTGAYNTAEIFNPSTWAFTTLTVNMTVAREGHAATLLNNGQVLITGGNLPGTGSLNTAELYNPTANTFTAVSSTMTTPRIYHYAVLLNGGTVLLSGGENDSAGNSTALNTAEIYDPNALTFTAVAGNMTSIREHQTATLLNDGTVLEDGGTDGTNIFNTAEIYTTSKLTGLASIAISPAAPSVPVGTQRLLVATGTFGNGSTQVLSSVLWSSSSPTVSTVTNDPSDTGFASSVAQGTATITATAAGISGSTTVTVSAPALVSITLSSSSLTMPLGTTQQFSAAGIYSDGSSQDLTSTATWTSSSGSATVSSSGLVTGVSLGNSTIQASSGSQSGSATVTVGAPALVALSLTPSSTAIGLGTTQQYQVIGTYTDGSTQNLTASAAWFAVPLTTASITSGGLATGIGQGTATVGVTTGGFDTIATLAVGAPSLVSIAVVPNATSVPVGSGQQFTATGNYTDGSSQDITSSVSWASSNQTAVSISSSGLASALAGGNSTITAVSGTVSGTAALTVGTGAAGLSTSRYQHGATLLNNGTVLISGGVNCPSSGTCTYLNSAELYTPSTATFATTGSMSATRSAPAILLGNGKVLVAGGYSCDSNGNCASLKSAEIYDPVSGTFSSAGNMTIDRYGHTMTLMSSGQVLIAGGETCSSATSCSALSAAELYDPVAGTFTATGNLNAARFNASAVALTSGLVLVAGGFDGTNYPAAGELYDPVAATFSNTSTNLNTPRANATATLLNNGEVLIAGGSTCATPGCPTSVAELYDNGSFYYFSYPTSNMVVSRWDQTATLLTNGEVLLAGGYDSCASSCISDGTTELFNPQGESFASSQALSTGRSGHTATLLTDGSVLLVGGINNGVTLSSSDSYQPSSLALPQLSVITIAPSNEPMVLGTTLRLVATGMDAYGDNLGTLQSVTWNSSSPSVATISYAAGSAGIVNSLSVGTTTITASIGTVSASTQITVTAPLVSIALSPSNPAITTNSPQELQLTATGVYSDGSSLNLTANVTWSTSNASVALVIPNSSYPGIVAPVAIGTANITATLGSISGSTPVTVTTPSVPIAPSVASVSPTSGSAGTQVSITGSGFGSSQGTGIIVLGTTLGTVVSWSDTQVVATVNTGSMSGVAEVEQGGLPSNTVAFTVNTASITNVSPTSGLPSTQVTLTGAGFGATQGSGNVWLGTAAGVVNSWSDGQVVATVASGSISGNAQILQNGVLSNAVAFTIDSLQISSITPTSGGAGTVVTINGGGFGSSQGSGNVWIGNTYGVVTGWSDTQLVATVGSNAVSGVVKVEQNAVWSNAVTFTVPPSVGSTTPVTLVPNIISMVVGGTQSIQALDANGNSVTGLTWTSSNPALATLSTDDPPIITAVATGNVTITAGDASADLTIYTGPTLPLGTIQWSNPGDGSGVNKIMPAVPSSTGVADVFALQQSGNVQAIRTDGTVGWTANIGGNKTLLPDFQGGLTVANLSSFPFSVQKLDGMTGQAYPAYTYSNPSTNGTTQVLVHTDGTIFTVDNNAIIGIAPTTGGVAFDPPLDQSSSYDDGDCGEFYPRTLTSPASVGQAIIAGDGYAYFPYFYTISSDTNICTQPNAAIGHTATHLRIMKVGTDGFSQEIKVGDWVQDSVTSIGYATYTTGSAPPTNLLGTLITNANQGVLFSWGGNQLTTVDTSGHPTTATLNLGSGASFGVQPVLQRADGTYVGTAVIETNGFPQHSMVAFTLSGQLLWSQTNYVPQIATSGGGTIATSLDGSTTATFDANGNQTGKIATLGTYSWTGANYRVGSIESFKALLLELENSYSTFSGANASKNNAAVNFFPPLANCANTPSTCPLGPGDAIWNAYQDLVSRLTTSKACSGAAQLNVFDKLNKSPAFRGDTNHNPVNTASFLRYLNNTPQVSDGTQSTWDFKNAWCGSGRPWWSFQSLNCSAPPGSTTIKASFQNDDKQSAATETPSDPLTIFFRPSGTYGIQLSNSGKNPFNEAMFFHEALHGITGQGDINLQTLFGYQASDPSSVITDYIQSHVLNVCPAN